MFADVGISSVSIGLPQQQQQSPLHPSTHQVQPQLRQRLMLVTGAPEAVLARCSHQLSADGSQLLHLDAKHGEKDAAATGTLRTAQSALIKRAASEGLRLIAYAIGPSTAADQSDSAVDAEKNGNGSSNGADTSSSTGPLIFLGALCFRDSIRPEVPSCVAQAHEAGISIAMVTGDHPLAAAAIALQAGVLPADEAGSNGAPAPTGSAGVVNAVLPIDGRVLHCGEAAVAASVTSPGDVGVAVASSLARATADNDNTSIAAWCSGGAAAGTLVYARATPADKLSLVRAYQAAGHTVLVTGDGVNDAPALAAADIGIAVTGATDVAQSAASIVVVSSDFNSILRCLAEGRRLRDNLVHALAFYLGAKLGLLILFVVGTLWQGFPMAPVQVIVLELFMDIGASTSFVAEPAVSSLMNRPPAGLRPIPAGAAGGGTGKGGRSMKRDDTFFDRQMLLRIGAGGLAMAGCVLSAMAYGHYAPITAADELGDSLATGAAGDRGSRARALSFIVWLLAHVTLAFNQRTAAEPVLLSKPLLGNATFTCWALAVAVLCIILGTVEGAQSVLDVHRLSPPDWGVAVAISVGGTFWIEGVKLAMAAVGKLKR